MAAHVVAIDLGASSGRLISASLNGRKIKLNEAYRFSNGPVQLLGHLYWDHLKILQEIKYGILAAYQSGDAIDSISVDTWGVDYGLINRRGQPISVPHSYRDTRMELYREKFFEQFSAEAFFMETGTQPENIISALQLFSDISDDTYLNDEIDHVLFMPELIEYLLSGKRRNEFTIGSTSGLLRASSGRWSDKICQGLGFRKAWFDPLPAANGEKLGPLLPEISNEVNLPKNIQVVSGIGHDTAAAVLATPFREKKKFESAFISCGTWSIVGVLTKRPIVSHRIFAAGLTNEGCFGGENRLLKNVTGLWIIQEIHREWSIKGEALSFDKMVELAENCQIDSLINPNDAQFAAPNEMEEKIQKFCEKSGQRVPMTHGEVIRVILQSLALSYRVVIDQLEEAVQKPIRTIHMIGGGIQNQLLCRMTAVFTGRSVIAGPIEASVIGNALSQFIIMGKIKKEEVSALVSASFELKEYAPDNKAIETEKLYKNYLKLFGAKSTV